MQDLKMIEPKVFLVFGHSPCIPCVVPHHAVCPRLTVRVEMFKLKMFYYHVQDTLNALEALVEYELKRSVSPEANLIAEFTVPGRGHIIKLTLEKKEDKVETDLKVIEHCRHYSYIHT